MFFSKQLKNISNLKHCFFSRKNGVSKGIYSSLNCGINSKDNKENVIQNINIVSKKLNCEKKPIVALNQNHGNKVVCFSNQEDIKNKVIGDAIVTTLKNVGISVLTADCVPILFYNPKKKIVGCAHAGWKGALHGILPSVIEAMEDLGAQRQRIVAAIGPTIAQASYEVGPEFPKLFLEQDPNNVDFFIRSEREGHFMFDLPGYVAKVLKLLKIGSVEDLARDTCAEESLFYSYRRATKRGDPDYGRCVSAITIT